jgi:ribosomal protein L14
VIGREDGRKVYFDKGGMVMEDGRNTCFDEGVIGREDGSRVSFDEGMMGLTPSHVLTHGPSFST